LTNFFSILLAGGGVLALLGLGSASTQHLHEHARRRAFIIIALELALVTIALASTSIRLTRETVAEYQTYLAVKGWLAPSGYEPESIDAHGDVVRVSIFGEDDLPPRSDLESALEGSYRRPETINLLIVPVQDEQLEVEPTSD
jgi:hypothetical protein